jgi:hypothetical protein
MPVDADSIRQDIERMKADFIAALAAVAQVRGLPLDVAREDYKHEARLVYHQAYIRAEERGTLLRQEVTYVAQKRLRAQ